MNERARMLDAIRRGLGRGPLEAQPAASLAARLAAPTPNRLPAASRGDRATLLRRFVAKLRRVDASVEALAAYDAVPAAVAVQAGPGTPVRVAPHPSLAGLDWAGAGLAATLGAARDGDAVGVSHAVAGVAESGTLVLCSGAESPTTLNFLPDLHLVVLDADAVTGSYEAVWAALRGTATDGRFLPRTVNWITGPSRTADIEQTLYLGIHGPRRLHVLLVGDDSGAVAGG